MHDDDDDVRETKRIESIVDEIGRACQKQFPREPID